MRSPTPTKARGALLAGGLLLAAGVAVVAWVLASSAGLVGGGDDPTMGPEGSGEPRRCPGGQAAATTAAVPSGKRPDRPVPAGAGRRRPGDGPPRGGGRPGHPGQGLMEREQVPPGTGMVFLYPEDVAEAFWMKNTLVPLSIAFVAADGQVSVHEMTPCRMRPLPQLRPGRPLPLREGQAQPPAPSPTPGSGRDPEWCPSTPQHYPNRCDLPGQRQDKVDTTGNLTRRHSTNYLGSRNLSQLV